MEEWKKAVAKKAHHIALDRARKEGRIETFKGRDGYIIDGVADGAYGFIMDAASKLSVNMRGSTDREEVRVLLKETGNLGTLGKPIRDHGGKHGHVKRYRIFVAAQWSNDVWVNAPSQSVKEIKFRERSKFVREPGGESGPVKELTLKEEFGGGNILSDESAGIIFGLFSLGGAVFERPGNTVIEQLTQFSTYSSSSVSTLRDRGFIKTLKTHEDRKRFSAIELTPKGQWAAENLTFTQIAEARIGKILSDLGIMRFTKPRHATSNLAEITHLEPENVRQTLRKMIRNGQIEPKWSGSGETYFSQLKWVGGTPEGWHTNMTVTPEPKQEQKQEKPVPVKTPQEKSTMSSNLETASTDELLDALIERMGQKEAPKGLDEFVDGVRDVIKQAHGGMSPFLALGQLETVLKSYDEATK